MSTKPRSCRVRLAQENVMTGWRDSDWSGCLCILVYRGVVWQKWCGMVTRLERGWCRSFEGSSDGLGARDRLAWALHSGHWFELDASCWRQLSRKAMQERWLEVLECHSWVLVGWRGAVSCDDRTWLESLVCQDTLTSRNGSLGVMEKGYCSLHRGEHFSVKTELTELTEANRLIRFG